MFVFKGVKFYVYFGGHWGKIWFFDPADKTNVGRDLRGRGAAGPSRKQNRGETFVPQRLARNRLGGIFTWFWGTGHLAALYTTVALAGPPQPVGPALPFAWARTR
jgi:hypothetical protein